MSEQSLVAACANGDSEALAQLFAMYGQQIYRFLGRITGGGERDLDDLVQNTFIEVLHSARRFRGDASVRSWIFAIARNVARHHMRSSTRRRHMLLRVAQAPPQAGPQPDTQLEHRELIRLLQLQLDKLPIDLKEVFVLVVLEEMHGNEAAQVLNIKEGTLWRRLHQARTLLNAAIEGARDGN